MATSRSGRGQALFKALSQPVRLPGQPANEEREPVVEQFTVRYMCVRGVL